MSNANAKTAPINVVHDAHQSRFYFDIDGTDVSAELLYSLTDNTVDFYRTFVPPEARGGKIAYKLVQTGIAWAEEQRFVIKASCWYVEKFLAARAS